MRLFVLFLRFFGYGLLGAELALALSRLLSNRLPSDNMAPQAASVFLALIWIPLGGVLAAAATAINRRIAADGRIVTPVAVAAGILFFGGMLLQAALGIGVPFLLPCALYLATAASLRWWQRRFDRAGLGES